MRRVLREVGGVCVVLAFVSACEGPFLTSLTPDSGPQPVTQRDAFVADTGSRKDTGAVDTGLSRDAHGSRDGAAVDALVVDGASSGSGSGSGIDSGPAMPPSCAAAGSGAATCGAASDSCCASLPVPGGTYDRTYTNSSGMLSGQADPATVSGYRLDKYLVTVGRFRPFANAWSMGYVPPAGSGLHSYLNGGSGLVNSGAATTSYETGWVTAYNSSVAPTATNLLCTVDGGASPYATWTTSPGSHEDLPINCVNWWEAYAFCIWDGGFLPSEAEWEYAAAAGSDLNEYPWGETDPGTTSQYAIYGCDYPSGTGVCTGTAADYAPVGTASLGAGRWGQLDMFGELWEVILDSSGMPLGEPWVDSVCMDRNEVEKDVCGAG